MTLYKLFDRNNIYIYPFYLAELTISKDIENVLGVKLKESFWTNEKAFVTAYYDIESAEKMGEIIISKIKTDKTFFKKVIDNIYKYSEEMMSFCKKIDKISNKDILTNQQLLDHYKEYMQKTIQLRAWGWIPVMVDGITRDFLTDHVMEETKKHLKNQEDKTAEIYSSMSSSEKSSAVQQEEKSRLKLILELKGLDNYEDIINDIKSNDIKDFYRKYPETKIMLEAHLKEYGWLPYIYIGPVMSLDYLFKSIKDDLSNKLSVEEQIEELENRFDNIKKEKEKIKKQYKLPEYLNYLYDVSSEFMYIKDYRKQTYQKSYVSMDKIMNEISKRLNLSLKETKYLIYEEVQDALLNKKDYKKIAQQRTIKCCFTVKSGIIKVYQGQECEEKIKEYVKPELKETKSTNEFKGATAYKGYAKGIAKIILVKEDVPKLKEGEVLVSSSTNPDLIIAMKKASAFVTDLGGIMSHAAIVARELKKPAVIGTKNATHIIKDGDIVEVDADKGIVKILNS
jgi:phosphoenolpyruvate synthase/pyruvate phosphate dikinase